MILKEEKKKWLTESIPKEFLKELGHLAAQMAKRVTASAIAEQVVIVGEIQSS